MAKYLGHSPIPFHQIEEKTFDDHVRSCSVGIDCHRDSYHVYVLALNQDTKKISERYCKFGVLEPDMERIKQFIRESEELAEDTVDLVILESTGPYSRTLFEFLAQIWATCLINPVEFSKYGKKTDKFDARKMAQLALQGLFQPSFLTTAQEEDLKRVSRLMVKVKAAMTRESNSLGSFLTHGGIGILRGPSAIKLMSKSGRQILEAIIAGKDAQGCLKAAEYYDPEKIPRDSKQTERRIGVHLGLKEALKKVDEISQSFREAIRVKYESYVHYETRYSVLEKELCRMLKAYEAEGLNGWDAVELLSSIPSVGERVASLLIAEITLRVRERFGPPQEGGVEKFVSYGGFNPARQYSADKETSGRRATPGAKYIRRAFVEAAQSLLKSTHPLGERIRVVERRNGGYRSAAARNMAVVAGGGKLVKAAYWVLFKREAFNDEQYDYTAVKREKTKKAQKLLKQFQQIESELKIEKGGETILQQLRQQMQGASYILNPEAVLLQPISGVIKDKRTVKVLMKAGCEKLSDVWCLISVDQLKSQKGVGEKTYERIIQALEESKILVRA